MLVHQISRLIGLTEIEKTLGAAGRFIIAGFLLSGLLPQVVDAQLNSQVFRSADSTKVYWILRHRNDDNLSINIQEVAITSIAASISAVADSCLIAGNIQTMSPAEAWSTTSLAMSLPVVQIVKSGIITDASSPAFLSAANGGAGQVCMMMVPSPKAR